MNTKETNTLCGLSLYFPINDDSLLPIIKQKTTQFKHYIETNVSNFTNIQQIEKDRYFSLDYKNLLENEYLLNNWPQFENDLITDTEFTLTCLAMAMYQFIYLKLNRNKIGQYIRARLYGFVPILQLQEINVNYLGKFVSIRGTVIKAGAIKIICEYMAFLCRNCQIEHAVKQIDRAYTPLNQCRTKGCRTKKNFESIHTSKLTRTIDWQSIIIQDDQTLITQSLECELTRDLVRTCFPGDDITISGILKVRDSNSNKGKNKQNALYNLYLEAVSVYNNKCESGGCSIQRIKFTNDDYDNIKQIQSTPNLFHYLIHSLCPSIYGNLLVKAGLLLALFKGTKSTQSRAESHVALIGDPGLGKSQMLKCCANVSPKGVYVCGNVSTTSGLTVTMIRESGGEYSLEAGALMLADQGCCCIDEFEKMPNQHAGLLEAMEQQSISIAKAGMICSLPTKPTILIAANPIGGHYNKAKTVAENIKLGSAMLSRFDLIFILLDRPNESFDKFLSKHILKSHLSKRRKINNEDEDNMFHSQESVLNLNDYQLPNNQHLPHNIFRKYIAYAQKNINPHLSNDAKQVLIDFYVNLRKHFSTGDCTPVTARQLHSLIRLTQARAKIDLRNEATINDAKEVIEIMKHSLIDVFTNENGLLDTTRSQMGTGMSYKNQVMKLLECLQRKSEIESKSIFTIKEITEITESTGILKNKLSNAIQSLNIQGYLLSKGQNKYQLNSAYL